MKVCRCKKSMKKVVPVTAVVEGKQIVCDVVIFSCAKCHILKVFNEKLHKILDFSEDCPEQTLEK